MSVKRNEKTKKWDCYFRYTDSSGKTIAKHKRGFETKKEAVEWEREFLLLKTGDLNMTFGNFLDLYIEDYLLRHKTASYKTLKYSLIKYESFKNLKMCNITPKTIKDWQNSLVEENYSASYLSGIQKRLVTIFNHAVNIYGLKENPFNRVKLIKSFKAVSEKEVWTVQEFDKFISSFRKNNIFYISIFYLLFYSGARIGEILALTIQDLDFENNTISITKTFTRVERKDIITAPKSQASVRVVDIPEKAMLILKRHIDTFYKPDMNVRIYPVAREIVRRTMMEHITKSGVKKIRIHDLRHSHVSLLINMGVNIFEVSKRIGHADTSITSKVYAHIYDKSGKKIAELLNATKVQPQ